MEKVLKCTHLHLDSQVYNLEMESQSPHLHSMGTFSRG